MPIVWMGMGMAMGWRVGVTDNSLLWATAAGAAVAGSIAEADGVGTAAAAVIGMGEYF